MILGVCITQPVRELTLSPNGVLRPQSILLSQNLELSSQESPVHRKKEHLTPPQIIRSVPLMVIWQTISGGQW